MMMIGSKGIALVLSSVALGIPWAWAQQRSVQTGQLLVEGPAGSVLLNPQFGSAWLRAALDQLAMRDGKILLRCGVIEGMDDLRERELHGHPIRVSNDIAGMRQVAALSGSEMVELTPEVLLLKSKKGICDEPMALTAENMSELGIPLDPALDVHALEVRLFQALGRRTLGPTVFGPSWSGLFYWASREGHGRELYVLSESTEDLSSTYPTSSLGLTKVAIEGTGTTLSIRRVWGTSCGGAVAALELDVDHDGVIDLFCFSGEAGRFAGNTPLTVLSGASGRKIGEIGGQAEGELVITEGPGGYRFRTRGAVDDPALRVTLPVVQTYSLKEGAVALEGETRGRPSELNRGPLLSATATTLDSALFAKDEHLVAHYFFWGPDHGIPKLGRIGDRVPRRTEDGRFPPTVHVLLDYRPMK